MIPKISSTPARVVLGMLALAVAGIFAFPAYRSQLNVGELFTDGEQITGVISGKNCANHGQVNYSFLVNRTRHVGSGSSCVPSCADARVGGAIFVTYAKKNSGNSECGSLKSAASRSGGHILGLLFVSVILGVAIVRVTRV